MTASDHPADPIPPELQALRSRIDQIDHDFLDLLAERNRLVSEVAGVKRTTGVPIRDPDREATLLADRRAVADRSGLSADVIESLFRLVLWASRNRQASLLAAVPPGMETRRIAIIGAAGGMGSLMCRLFQSLGHEVLSVDRDSDMTIEEAASAADITLVSVDIRETESVIKQVGPCVPPEGLLMDVTSIKRPPVEAMCAYSSSNVIGTHPLFGPNVHTLQGQRIAVTPGRLEDNRWMDWLRGTFAAAGLTLLETNPEDHDRVMSVVQVLTHYSTEVLGRTMKAMNVSIEETLRFTSPIYHLELLMTARHFAQSADLYSAIQMSNPNTPEVTAAFRSAAADLDALLVNGDIDGFRDSFDEISHFFGPFAETALKESSHLIDRLVERS